MGKYLRKTLRKSWGEEDLSLAIEQIKNGKSFKSIAHEFNIPRTTLTRKYKEYQDRLKENNSITAVQPTSGFQRTFNNDQEQALYHIIIDMQNKLMGLSPLQIRKLAFDYAKKEQIITRFNQEKELAGRDWLRGFMKRFGLSNRKAEHTSKDRAYGFNKTSVMEFYDLLEKTLQENQFTPDRIYNVDETGVSVNPKSTSRIVAKRGMKQVGGMVASERGETVTAVLSMAADGRVLPFVLIYPRVNRNAEFLKGAPPGAWAEFNRTGWIDEDTFTIWMEKFIQFSNASLENPVLLLVDGHVTHIKNLKVLMLAMENGVIMLNFPPHCTHRLQPLDLTFMKSVNDKYKNIVNEFLQINKTVSMKHIMQLFGQAWQESAISTTTAINGFKKAGIVPFNRNLFKDSDFAVPSREARKEDETSPEVQKCISTLREIHRENSLKRLNLSSCNEASDKNLTPEILDSISPTVAVQGGSRFENCDTILHAAPVSGSSRFENGVTISPSALDHENLTFEAGNSILPVVDHEKSTNEECYYSEPNPADYGFSPINFCDYGLPAATSDESLTFIQKASSIPKPATHGLSTREDWETNSSAAGSEVVTKLKHAQSLFTEALSILDSVILQINQDENNNSELIMSVKSVQNKCSNAISSVRSNDCDNIDKKVNKNRKGKAIIVTSEENKNQLIAQEAQKLIKKIRKEKKVRDRDSIIKHLELVEENSNTDALVKSEALKVMREKPKPKKKSNKPKILSSQTLTDKKVIPVIKKKVLNDKSIQKENIVKKFKTDSEVPHKILYTEPMPGQQKVILGENINQNQPILYPSIINTVGSENIVYQIENPQGDGIVEEEIFYCTEDSNYI